MRFVKIILGALLMLLALGFVAGGRGKIVDHLKTFEKNGVDTYAVVTAKDFKKRGIALPFVRVAYSGFDYTFTDAKGKPVRGHLDTSTEQYKSLNVGDKVKVRYDPSNPNLHRLTEYRDDSLNSVGGPGAMVFNGLVFLGGLYLVFRNLRSGAGAAGETPGPATGRVARAASAAPASRIAAATGGRAKGFSQRA